MFPPIDLPRYPGAKRHARDLRGRLQLSCCSRSLGRQAQRAKQGVDQRTKAWTRLLSAVIVSQIPSPPQNKHTMSASQQNDSSALSIAPVGQRNPNQSTGTFTLNLWASPRMHIPSSCPPAPPVNAQCIDNPAHLACFHGILWGNSLAYRYWRSMVVHSGRASDVVYGWSALPGNCPTRAPYPFHPLNNSLRL